MRFFPFVLLLALFATGCETDVLLGDPSVPTPTANDGPQEGSGEFGALAAEALSRVNALRAEGCFCGSTFYPPAPALELHPQLIAAAVGHSADQAARGSMGHVGSDGSRVGARVTRAGFTWRGVAENVAWNQRSVAQVIEAWKNSGGHCTNLMNPDYLYMGFAVEDWYWTQVFAR